MEKVNRVSQPEDAEKYEKIPCPECGNWIYEEADFCFYCGWQGPFLDLFLNDEDGKNE